ncbi:flagellar hook-associated protein FlgK [Porticoccaceae bacterium]|nr:flagellar hook-associated protein FlgK [Porticoccaceae bacterium]
MSDILSIGAGATQLYRQSLATVSNNIANLNTEGYSRQVTSSAEGMPSQQGTVFIGTGARLQGIARAYDEFIESSLRNSSSDLSTQEPMIQYANRIVDLLGSQTSGLSSALDQFFASASDLSADPGSTIQRNKFVRDADALASRFREIAGHFSAIEQESRSSVELQVSTINTLSQQLVTVNSQLSGKISIDKQPPGLLDQRDQILRDLADISKIHVTESTDGQVAVRLSTSSGTLLVDGKASVDLGVSFDPNDSGRVDILVEPYGETRAASSVTSGVLGGLINFRTQTLGPAMDNFDYLAQTMVAEVNQIHSAGIDSRGQRGTDLFQIGAVFDVEAPTVESDVSLEIKVADPAAFKFAPFKITWMSEDSVWRVEDGTSGAVTFAQPINDSFTYAGLEISSKGRVEEGDTFFVEPRERPAAGFNLVQKDPLAIAAAERLRVIAHDGNISESKATLNYGLEQEFQGFNYGTNIISLGNNDSSAAAVTVDASNFVPAFVIPRGADSVALMMDVPEGSDLQYQVMTNEGIHLLGHSIDSGTESALMSGDPAFHAESSYSSTYLNATGTDAYRNLDMTYGHLARSFERQDWVPNVNGDGMYAQTVTEIAQVASSPVRLQQNNAGIPIDMISSNSLILNGQALSAYSLADGESSSAAAMATWLNSASANTGVTVTASNEISVAAEDINLLEQLTINGQLVGNGALPADVAALSSAINALSDTTNVQAYVTSTGGLVMLNTAGNEGETIALGNPDSSSATNALGMANQVIAGQLQMQSSDQIRFTFGSAGGPTDLGVLGLRTGVYINNAADEDLAVFITGTGSASVAAGFSTAGMNLPPSESPFKVDFLSADQYSIIDSSTGTVVATRDYVAGGEIQYQGLTLSFDSAPKAGDSFVVDGNENGVGDNGNMLMLVALQDKPVLQGSRTLSDGYIDLVSTVGNKATLSKISQEALAVVYDQAVQSKDQVSGVSLDQEAADLIRLQQAYQASAQIIQMSSKIFDSILGIR